MMRNSWASVSICLIFLSSTAIAGVKLSKAQEFLKKNDSCYFAVALSNPKVPASTDPDVSEEVFCATDGSIGAGTIHEKSGCSLMMFNMDSGSLRKATFNVMMDPRTVNPAIVEDTQCANGGFEKLLETKFTSFYGVGPKVKEILFNGPQGFKVQTVVAFSKSDSVGKTYNAAVAKIAEEAKLAEVKAAEKKKTDLAKAKQDSEARKKSKVLKLTQIEGTWTQSCRFSSSANANTRLERIQSDGHFTVSTYLYATDDKKCAKLQIIWRSTGTYKVGGTLASNQNLKMIDLEIKKAVGIPKTEEAAQVLTSKSTGGIMVWEVGKEHDVTAVAVKDKKFYTVFKIDGDKLSLSQDPRKIDPKNRDTLKFGDDADWIRKNVENDNEDGNDS